MSPTWSPSPWTMPEINGPTCSDATAPTSGQHMRGTPPSKPSTATARRPHVRQFADQHHGGARKTSTIALQRHRRAVASGSDSRPHVVSDLTWQVLAFVGNTADLDFVAHDSVEEEVAGFLD